MKRSNMLPIMVLVLCLMIWPASVASGAQSLTVNGQLVKSITLEVGQSCAVEVVSDDSASYTDYVGFDDRVVRGTFLHVETMPAAGNSATVTEYNERDFYGYYVVADGFKSPPSAGIHFVFEYEAQQVGETDLKLYQNSPPPSAGSLLDSVHITVIPAPMGTAITYQGSLNDTGNPADGLYDFQFKLYDSINGGNQEGNTIDINDVDVIEGQFVVELDFGSDPNIFNGYARWLQVGVRPGDSIGAHTRLSPRIELMPTPYAIYAKNAGDDGDWAVSGNDMYSIPSGNVGIGTTSPYSLLDVRGAIRTSRSSGQYIEIVDSSAAAGTITGWSEENNKKPLVIRNVHDGSGSAAGETYISMRVGDANSPTIALTIRESGNVGIGTTSPWAGLHLKATGYPNSFMYLQSDTGEDTGFRLYEGDTIKWHLYNDSDLDGLSLRNNTATVLFAQQSTGNVGIGTTAPEAKFDITNPSSGPAMTVGRRGGYPSILARSNASGGWLIMDSNGAGNVGLNYYDDGHVILANGGGNVGIGTMSPSGDLYTSSKTLEIEGTAPSIVLDDTEGTWQSDFEIVNGGDRVQFRNATDDIDIMSIWLTPVSPRVSVKVLEITGGSDLSEQFEVSDEDGKVKPGMVVCIDAANPGNLVVSKESYDRTVAGIVSGAGGVKPGMLMGQKGTKADGDHPVALTGRVYCWADASNSPIEPGDLLTTSDMAGHAMKVTDYSKAQGAILGKAMSSLEEDRGLVLVLVTLQ